MVKNLPANAGDVSLIHGLGRSPGDGNGFSHKRQAGPETRLGQEKAIKVGIVNSEPLPQEAMTTSLSQTPASCTSQVSLQESLCREGRVITVT